MELTQDQVNRIHSMAAQCLNIMEKQDRKGQYNVLVKLYTDQFKESNKSREYYGELQTWQNLTGTYEKHVKQCEIKMAELQKGLNATAAELQNEKGKTYRWYQAYNEQKATMEKGGEEQSKLKEEVQKLETEKSRMQEQLDALQNGGAGDEKIQKLIAQQQEQTAANDKLREENQDLQEEIEELKAELEEAKNSPAQDKTGEKLSVEVDDLNAENHQLKIQLDELQQKQPEQAKANKILHEKNEKLLKEVDNLRNERQLLKEQLEMLENQNVTKRERPARDDDDEMDEEMEELIEEKEELEDKVDELQNVNKQLKEQLSQMEEKSKEAVLLQKKCSELSNKNKWLQKQNDELEKAAKSEKKTDAPTIQEQFEKMGLDYDEMQHELDSLRIEKQQLIQQKAMVEAQSNMDTEALRKEIEELKEQLAKGGSVPSVSAQPQEVPEVPDVPVAPTVQSVQAAEPKSQEDEAFKLSTSPLEVDKHEDSKFLNVMLLGTKLHLSEMPAKGAPIVVIENKAYPNPHFYKGFTSGMETTSSVRPLNNLFDIEGLLEDWKIKYSLKSIEPAEMKTDESGIQLEKKGKIVLLPDMK
ncbi:MAG: hypothetical protein IJ642_13335 [Oscillospiraceae bacterium]|nr:hypothetical protein [Oscillospiraceae bacterium]